MLHDFEARASKNLGRAGGVMVGKAYLAVDMLSRHGITLAKVIPSQLTCRLAELES